MALGASPGKDHTKFSVKLMKVFRGVKCQATMPQPPKKPDSGVHTHGLRHQNLAALSLPSRSGETQTTYFLLLNEGYGKKSS